MDWLLTCVINMQEMVLKTKVNEFLAQKVKKIVKRGLFENEEQFLKSAIRDMVKKYEIQEMNLKLDEFAREMAKKHPKSLSEMVLAVRTEENETV